MSATYTGDLLSKWWKSKNAKNALRVEAKKRRDRLAQLRNIKKKKHRS